MRTSVSDPNKRLHEWIGGQICPFITSATLAKLSNVSANTRNK